jgi:DeoR/GlpR family transcriptional regulator of sugar metabolism
VHDCADSYTISANGDDMNALPDERQQLILHRLSQEGRALASELARAFHTSEDTIRRDLREMAAAGLCRRVYGGALPLSPASGALAEREVEMPEPKIALGRAMARLVSSILRPGQVLFLDAGSTNLAVARALSSGLGLTVVTNAPGIAAALIGEPGIEVMVIGGRINPRVGAALGGRAIRDAREVRPDLSILGACAIDAEAGVAAFDPEDAEFKSAVAECSSAIAVAVTNNKLGTTAPFAVIPATAVTHLVVETGAPKIALERMSALGVRVHRASLSTGEA